MFICCPLFDIWFWFSLPSCKCRRYRHFNYTYPNTSFWMPAYPSSVEFVYAVLQCLPVSYVTKGNRSRKQEMFWFLRWIACMHEKRCKCFDQLQYSWSCMTLPRILANSHISVYSIDLYSISYGSCRLQRKKILRSFELSILPAVWVRKSRISAPDSP